MATLADPPPPVNTVAHDRPPLVELKNGKVVFKQKSLLIDKHSETMKEIVDFREMLSKAAQPLTEMPPQHHSLIAKLVHESDKTLAALSKSVRQQLVPDDADISKSTPNGPVDSLPISVIEKSIIAVADRVNYGAEPFQAEGRAAKLPPANLCLWRWEAKDFSALPDQVRERAEARRAERIIVKAELSQMLGNLPVEQRASLFGVKQDPGSAGSSAVTLSAPQIHAVGKENEPLSVEKRGPGRPPKDAVVKQETSEKQTKAQEATKKSAAAFAKFFTAKTKPIPRAEPTAAKEVTTKNEHQPTEFERTFHPFVVKKNIQLAPINFFHERQKDVIVIDGEESAPQRTKVEDIAKDLLRSVPSAYRCRPRKGPKTSNPYTVRQLLEVLSDAEIRGDEQEVARLARLLKDRSKIPLKVLAFADNNRPGYIGTWTRQSTVIGTRAPLARDAAALDYSCDSGEEWEDEEEGEDVVSNAGSARDEEEMSDEESFDGWLVGDDEEVGGERVDFDELEGMDFDPKVLKRKIEPSEEQPSAAHKEKRRRVVCPLVPFVKGPSWESVMGECPTWDGFRPHRIQLFNDAQYPIDPFTYVSEVVSEKARKQACATTTNASKQVAPNPNPAKLDQAKAPLSGAAASSSNASKVVFPEEMLPALEQGIKNCKTGSLNVLVDTIFQSFKQDHAKMKIKKYAIEGKVKEIAQKSIDPEAPALGKIWRLATA